MLMVGTASNCAVEGICATTVGIFVSTLIPAGRGLDFIVCGPSWRSKGGVDNASKYPKIMYSNLRPLRPDSRSSPKLI